MRVFVLICILLGVYSASMCIYPGSATCSISKSCSDVSVSSCINDSDNAFAALSYSYAPVTISSVVNLCRRYYSDSGCGGQVIGPTDECTPVNTCIAAVQNTVSYAIYYNNAQAFSVFVSLILATFISLMQVV